MKKTENRRHSKAASNSGLASAKSSHPKSSVAGKRPLSPFAPSEKLVAKCWEALVAHWNRGWPPMILLIGATLVAYWPAMHGELIWDDDSWTTKIEGLLRNRSGLAQIWFHPTALQQYYPLAATSFWLDYHLWGFRTFPYHLENVLLHAFGAVLFAHLLMRLQVPGAWLAAFIFALHPVMVESAAWITERKNVLSLVFYLGALLVYGKLCLFWRDDADAVFASKTPRWSYWRMHALAFMLFVAALLSKITAFSLPAVVLLICWWKRGRIRWSADVMPLIPWFAATIGLGTVTSWMEKHHLGATGSAWNLSFWERLLIAGRSFWFYMGKLIWPADLCFVYLRWKINTGSFLQWCFPAAAIAILSGLWMARTRIGRGPITAALFYVGTLFPVLGFMNAYFMRFSFVCDHWVYISSLGLIALVAAFLARTFERNHFPLASGAVVILPIIILSFLTWHQCAMYADNETLYRKILASNPDCVFALNNLGTLYEQKGQIDDAIDIFERSIKVDSTFPSIFVNLAQARCNKGQFDQAIATLEQGLKISPNDPDIQDFYGVFLNAHGQIDEAMRHFQKSVEAAPNFPGAHNNLAVALIQRGRTNEAIAQFQKAAELDPENPDIQSNLGKLLLDSGQYKQALLHLRRSLQLRPNHADTLTDLAWLLATCPDASLRDGVKSLALAQQADQQTEGKNYRAVKALAAAYAETGHFPEAVITAQKALALVPQYDAAAAEALKNQIKLYNSNVAFHHFTP